MPFWPWQDIEKRQLPDGVKPAPLAPWAFIRRYLLLEPPPTLAEIRRHRQLADAPPPPPPVVTDAELTLSYFYTRRALLELDAPRAILPLGSKEYEAVTEAFISLRSALAVLEGHPNRKADAPS